MSTPTRSRVSTRARGASRSASRATSSSAPTASGSCSPAAGAAPIRSTACGSPISSTGGEQLVADPDALARRRPPTTCRPRSAPGASVHARRPAASPRSPPTPTSTVAAFALGGRLFVADLRAGTARELAVDGPVFDPRPSPTGDRVAYVRGAALCVADVDGTGGGASLAVETSPGGTVTWGSADFIAAEEMQPPARATGGRPTARRSPPAASTWRRSRCGTSPTRPTRRRARRRALSSGRHRQPRRHAPPVPARRFAAARGRVGSRARSPTSPTSTGPSTR